MQRLTRGTDGRWTVEVRDIRTGARRTVRTRFVFVGAGGGALPLLQGSGIPEIRGFGGFPVSGKFLRTTSPELVAQHQAKVYGQAAVGAPPMSVPHLDLRLSTATHSLLFGPYAGFSPKFLKAGHLWDLPLSVRGNNLGSMLGVAKDNIPLTKYLVTEVLKSQRRQARDPAEFLPPAEEHDWEMITAGQRVQVIKSDPVNGAACCSSAPSWSSAARARSPACSAPPRAPPRPSRRCSPCSSAASRSTPRPGGRGCRRPSRPTGTQLSEDPALLAEIRRDTMQTLELNG